MKVLRIAFVFLLATACIPLKPTTKNDVFPGRAQLPQEEAPHPKNSLEWWYFTGHLKDVTTGQSFGVEYVFFHFNPTGKQDYQMVNFALTDPQTQQFRYDYDLGKLREPLTAALPINLTEQKKDQRWTLTGQEGRYRLQARMAAHAGQAIDLTTTPVKPVLLHGGTGYEQYGPVAQAGYYSYPRLATTGTIEVGGQVHQVAGELWYDRQWNCGGVNKRNVAWDWLSLQLDEPKEELMLYAVHETKSGQQIGGGSLFGAQGENLHLAETDFKLEPVTYWTSATSKKKYPATWHLTVPSKGYDLTVTPLVPNQELNLRLFKVLKLNYWEGMCRVTGTHHGQPVTGNAYVEITNR
ncbi:lipocalin family protein [Hymenobacter sp.]|uniref:lipocalin family protein n=1 Tax=Hymenobacter sp. TaxID=1898978 RepID=UPI00286CC51F|nr:lipocalin family protein [Hymenobacter sp.]